MTTIENVNHKYWSGNLNKFNDNIPQCLLDENLSMYINFDEVFRDLCTYGHFELVKMFIEKNLVYEIDVINDGFSSACCYGHIDIVNYLMSKSPFQASSLNFNEGFVYACKGGHIQIAKLMISSTDVPIIDFHRSVDVMCGKYFYTSAEYSKEHMEIVDFLALHLENINITEYDVGSIYTFDTLINFYSEYKKTQMLVTTKLHESLIDFILTKL